MFEQTYKAACIADLTPDLQGQLCASTHDLHTIKDFRKTSVYSWGPISIKDFRKPSVHRWGPYLNKTS